MNNSIQTYRKTVRSARANSSRCLSGLAGVLLLGACVPATLAADAYFSGASGTMWDASTTADWGAGSGGPYTSLWNAGDRAIFEGVPTFVNVSGTDIPTCGGITFNVDGYTLSGGQINMMNNSKIVMPAANLTATISSVLADDSSASKVWFTGASYTDQITLSVANTFTGEAYVQGASVNFDDLENGGVASDFGQGTNAIALGAGSASSAIINYINGTGASTDRPLLVGGSANGGNCVINNNGYGPISFNNTGDAMDHQFTDGNRNLTLGGSYHANSSTFAGALSDLPGYRTTLSIGGSHWNILGTNSFSGGVVFKSSSYGQLMITNDMALGNPTNGIRFSINGTLNAVNLGAPVQNDVTINSARTITLDSGKIAYFGTPDTNNLIVAAYITGPGSVRKQSSSYAFGTVRFTCDTNDYTGDFGINYGKVEFTSVANQGVPSSLGAATSGTGAITMGYGNSATTLKYIGAGDSSTTRPLVWQNPTTGCILDASGAGTISYLASADIKQNTGSAYIRLQGTNTGLNTLAQVINDNGGTTSLQKQDAGTWVLTGANTYSGTTAISGGTLSVSSDANLGTAPGSATPDFLTINSGALSASASFTLNANRGIALGPTTASGSGALDVASGMTLSYGGVIAANDTTGTNIDSLVKTGAGTLTLSGANTYNGDTTISGGTLALTGSGTIGSGANLIINAGGTFDVSALGGGYALSAGQALLATNGATATINGSLNAAAGSMVISSAISTPTLNVTGGAFTLGGSTQFEVDVNNGGTPLSAGSYKLISAGASGSVVGPAPAAVTVGGDGLAAGATASLSISGGELYLDVVGGVMPPSTPVIGGIQVSGGQAVLTFSGTNGTWFVLSSTNVALPLADWATNATGTFSSMGSIVNWTNSSPVDPQRFYTIKAQ